MFQFMFMMQLLVKFRFFIQETWERKSLQILYECWRRAYHALLAQLGFFSTCPNGQVTNTFHLSLTNVIVEACNKNKGKNFFQFASIYFFWFSFFCIFKMYELFFVFLRVWAYGIVFMLYKKKNTPLLD
jgi:hypothetical protein